MKNALHRKLRNQKGFTLAEVLLAVLIMLLAGTIVVAGIPAAANVYYKVMDGANAQLLLSTTCTALRRELAFAEEVKVESGTNKVQSFVNEEGYELTLISKDAAGKEEGIKKSYTGSSAEPILLVSKAAATKDMYAKFDRITYTDGAFIVHDLKVVKNGHEYMEPIDFTVKTVRKPTAA